MKIIISTGTQPSSILQRLLSTLLSLWEIYRQPC